MKLKLKYTHLPNFVLTKQMVVIIIKYETHTVLLRLFMFICFEYDSI